MMATVIKRIVLFSAPFIIVLLVYMIFDPFMILYKHNDYNKNSYIHKNLDFITTEKFQRNSQYTVYDSFIFGGSTSLYTTPSDWKKYICTSSEAYSFNASGENIVGIWSKIQYLNSHNVSLKNALLIFDTDGTFAAFINDNPIFMKHYDVYPSSKLFFHYRYFLNFINFRFLLPYLHYNLTDHFYPYMRDVLVGLDYYYEPITNEYHNVGILSALKRDSLAYYEQRSDKFVYRNGESRHYHSQISDEHIEMLLEIREIFKKNNTDFRILIGPTYDQVSYNGDDLKILQNIFNSNNVHDFTGINKYTEHMSSFYDAVHFKRYVGDEMLDEIYED